MLDRNYPEKAVAGEAMQARRLDITLRQNIDQQIVQAKNRVEELERVKERLSTSGILDTRIDDINQATRW